MEVILRNLWKVVFYGWKYVCEFIRVRIIKKKEEGRWFFKEIILFVI